MGSSSSSSSGSSKFRQCRDGAALLLTRPVLAGPSLFCVQQGLPRGAFAAHVCGEGPGESAASMGCKCQWAATPALAIRHRHVHKHTTNTATPK